MESSIFRQIADLAREHKTAARATAVFLCLALVVTLTTVGILTHTGQAMTQKVKVLTCTLEVHQHTADCKDETGALVCGYADYVVHIHNDDCYDENGILVCTLPQIGPHTHTAACYGEVKTPICGQEETPAHVHTEACYQRERGELTCAVQEHTHGDECFLRESVLTCDKTEDPHVHTDACYTVSRDLTCGQEESEEHTHSDACYTETRTLVCDKTVDPHVHTDACYTVNETLTCQIPEHVHTDECYAWTETLICEIPEGQVPEGGHVHTDECFEVTKELTCGQLENHEHTDACFVLDGAGNRTGRPICGKTELLEHVHGEDCFTIEEREADEPSSGPFFFQLFETEDLQTVCGKTEHTHDDSCLNEAGELICGLEEHVHDDSCFPSAESSGDNAEAAPEASAAPEYLCGKTEHTHDDTCLDENGEIVCGLEEHVHDDSCLASAPAADTAPAYVCGKTEHTHDDTCLDEDGQLICGLEEHTHDESCLVPAPAEIPGTQTKTYKDAGILVTVAYTEEALIPEEAELRVTQITSSDGNIAAYEQNMEDVRSAVEGQMEVSKVLLYDIGFRLPDGTEVEPAVPVTVVIQFLDADGIPSGAPVTVVHFADHGAEVLDSVADGSGVRFETGSFSPFGFIANFLDATIGLAIGEGDEEPSTGDTGTGNMADLLDNVDIVTESGATVEGGILYVGEKYKITLTFAEGGAVSAKQFEWTDDGTMTFQLPANFKVDPKSDIPLTIKVNGEDVVIGKYSVTEDGKLVVTLNEEGKKDLDDSFTAKLNFEMDATVQAGDGSDGGHIKFDDAGENFDFNVVDQARVEVDKQGKYTEYTDSAKDTEGAEGSEGEGNKEQENASKAGQGGILEYTVTTTVKRGSVHDLSILDEFTPPNTSALKIEDVNPDDIKVKLKQRGVDDTVTEIELKKGEDYELVEVPDEEHPGKKTFQVKLKEGSQYSTLNEGDVLEVTYPYEVEYVKGSTDVFWGNVANDVHVTGKGKVPATTEEPGKETPEIGIDEHRGSNVEIQVVPPGDGIIFKTQEFSEADHKLHYTLYTMVPAGNWKPFYIHDDMAVEFGGVRYNLQEFKKDGRVSNLKVSAVDVTDQFKDWDDDTDDLTKIGDLEKLKKSADELKGYDMDHVWYNSPEGYDPDSVENCIRLWQNNNLDIVFGEWTYGDSGPWGNWNYTEANRLIITEYDLDMSNDKGPLTLVDTSDYKTTIEKEASEVLLAGIRNVVHMRFDGYNPGYSVFFNNADRMNKTGAPDKSDNTITWTVTMNTTDTTVNQYFQEVKDDWMKIAGDKYQWWQFQKAYEESMQAVFYDELPDGWEYVEGSLTATASNGGRSLSYPYDKDNQLGNSHALVTQDGDRQVISAPLMFFYDNLDIHNLFDWFNDSLTSLTFTYKLKATDEWIRDHATDTDAVNIPNRAEIRDKLHKQAHWTADANVPYLPQHLSKEAVQVGDSNLLQFTLSVNPGSVQLDSDQGYLVVTDTSTNLEIQKSSIKVTDAAGRELTQVNYTEGMTLGEDAWALMPETESGQFKLMVPDGKALLVTYNALIPTLGTGIPVSNKAGIEGVVNADSGFDRTINVNSINAGGSTSTYTLNFQKVDSIDNTKKLPGAQFKFYVVLDGTEDGEDKLKETEKIPVGGKEYSCHSEEGWEFTTNDKGEYQIPGSWRLAPGNYYILEETEAPAGYEKAEPVLFYFGDPREVDNGNYPGAEAVIPGTTLTVPDPPIPYSLPESGGSGLEPLYGVGIAMITLSAVLFLERDARRRRGEDA